MPHDPSNRFQLLSTCRCFAVFVLLVGCLFPAPTQAQGPKPGNRFLQYIKGQAAELRSKDVAPEKLDAWQAQRTQLRTDLEKAWGGFPTEHAELEPRVLETLPRDGYRVEKIVFQTLPDVWMTANAYVPEGAGKRPAVLCVHGHWKGAKQDPHVQARCIGLAKLGFFVLAVDAMGAGERAIGKALGEYHGEMVGAMLWPVGRPLSGLQVYENRRAVDYLLTRSEVDGDRLGITGASGGGNQTMYAGAFDERFKAVVPVCSVGTYQAYLGAACCMCEVVPGALRFTEEWGVLSLTAPRALMVVSATKDAFQFSVGEAAKSLAFVKPVYQLYGKPSFVRHAVFESPHDYNREMREAMYGWMTRHLKGEGDGSPIAEPEMQTEEPEMLRCFPGESRPDDWLTIPRFAAREGRRLLEQHPVPVNSEEWTTRAAVLRKRLDEVVLGGTTPKQITVVDDKSHTRHVVFSPEPGVTLNLTDSVASGTKEAVIVISIDGADSPTVSKYLEAVSKSGRNAVSFDLRATGKHAFSSDRIGRAADHNTAEWSLLLGRPLLGQWVRDVRSAISSLKSAGELPDKLTVIGVGPAGIVALCAAVLDERIDHVVSVNALGSFISTTPYEGQRLGLMVPGILRDVGDISHIAALVAPRRLTIAGAVAGDGGSLSEEQLTSQFGSTHRAYGLMGSAQSLAVTTALSASDVVAALAK